MPPITCSNCNIVFSQLPHHRYPQCPRCAQIIIPSPREPVNTDPPSCPHCNEDLDELRFSENISGYQHGTEGFPLYEDNAEIEETDIQDTEDRTYECPHCGHGLTNAEIRTINEQWDRHIQATRENARLLGDNIGVRPDSPIERIRNNTNSTSITSASQAGVSPEALPEGEGQFMHSVNHHRRFETNETRMGEEGRNTLRLECPRCQHAYEDTTNSLLRICPRCNFTVEETTPQPPPPYYPPASLLERVVMLANDRETEQDEIS